jgi:hypothetical protein
MKKLNLWLLASLFVAAFTLAACGDDNDDKPRDNNPLFGRWEGQQSSQDGTTVKYALTIKDDKNVTLEYRMYSAGGGLHNGYNRIGTYQINGQTLNVNFTTFERVTGDKETFIQDDHFEYTYRLENDKLYISGEDDSNGWPLRNVEFAKK